MAVSGAGRARPRDAEAIYTGAADPAPVKANRRKSGYFLGKITEFHYGISKWVDRHWMSLKLNSLKIELVFFRR